MKITLPITALAAILALAGLPVHAQTTATAPAAAPAPATAKAPSAKKIQYTGTLSAIDTAGSTITLTDKTATPKTLTIAPTTKFHKDGKAATLADFVVGDKVTGSFTTDATGKMTAASLNKGSKKKAAAAKTTATGTTTPAAAN